ncbi:sensor histidine kinase [Streptomyces sp. NBC_00885]|uniref:ATP-binding protein n=1 Tax=Streptomyces sp. NBC_00885 TaxID=2975857 RepID=UPI0038702539|nr:sensor histidine kinase [Streptomyces sp. NBC_00885]
MSSIPDALPTVLAVGATASTLVAAPLLVRARRLAVSLRRERNTALQRQARLEDRRLALEEETQHLVQDRLPALVTHLAHRHIPIPGLLHPAFAGTGIDVAHRGVMDQLAQAVAAERQRVDEAAQTVMRGATTVIQAQSYQIQSKIAAMQHHYDSPDIAGELLELDHLNEQNLRRIQATGVLCGAWPGLTRADSHLGDVVIGAQSRIRGYHRVQVTSQLTNPVAVVARAVEPVAIAVAELLANAVHHSHGSLSIDVSLHQVQAGVCVVIDDAGVGMHPDEVEFATRLLTGQQAILLTTLGDPPRSGFATIGRLTQKYSFSVSVDKPAPYGGVRAVVFIPAHLLTLLDEQAHPMSAMAPLPRTAAPAAAGTPLQAPQPAADTADGELPRRRRRHPQPTADAPAAPPEPARTPEEAEATWSAFQAGTASGRAAVHLDHSEGTHQ